MHPITSTRGRLGSYLAAWIPISGILLVTLVSRPGVLWGEGSALALLLGLVYALLALPVWYVCRANPLRGTDLVRSLAAHTVGALVFAAVLNVAARILTLLLGSMIPPWSGLSDRVQPVFPLLFFMGGLFYLLVAAFYYIVLGVESSAEAERHEDHLKNLAGHAELKALRAQLNPHFLFNSLNSISSLTTSDPAAAREMCVRLADFFRMSLGLGDRTSVTLDEELALMSNYLAVEAIRLGDRLKVVTTVDPEIRGVRLPPLLLQPLVENGVLHGVATITEGGTLSLRADRFPDRVRIQVDNPFDPHAPRRPGSGRGLDNVRRRMEAHFGKDGRMTTDVKDGRFRVVLSVPLTGSRATGEGENR